MTIPFSILLHQTFTNDPSSLATDTLCSLIQNHSLSCTEKALLLDLVDKEVDKPNNVCRPIAIFLRGFIYQLDGQFDAAIALYDRAIQLGDSTAMTVRADMLAKGIGSEMNVEAAIALYEQAISYNNVIALNNFALFYETSPNHLNPSKAEVYYKLAISYGESIAALNLGQTCLGTHDPVKYQLAKNLFEGLLAKEETPKALAYLGHMALQGIGVDRDYIAAQDSLQKAAQSGSTWALNMLASMYASSKISHPSPLHKAFDLYQKSMQQGNLNAIYYCASMYHQDFHNYDSALPLYRLAIQKKIQTEKVSKALKKIFETQGSLNLTSANTYHLFMAMHPFTDQVPEKFKELIACCPDIINLVLNDEYLTQSQRQILIDTICVPLLDMACGNLSTQIEMALDKLEQIPSLASCYADALMLKADIHWHAWLNQQINPSDTIALLEKVVLCYQDLFDTHCKTLFQEALLGFTQLNRLNIRANINAMTLVHATEQLMALVEKLSVSATMLIQPHDAQEVMAQIERIITRMQDQAAITMLKQIQQQLVSTFNYVFQVQQVMFTKDFLPDQMSYQENKQYTHLLHYIGVKNLIHTYLLMLEKALIHTGVDVQVLEILRLSNNVMDTLTYLSEFNRLLKIIDFQLSSETFSAAGVDAKVFDIAKQLAIKATLETISTEVTQDFYAKLPVRPNWSSLPQTIKKQIFSFFNHNELKTMRLVNQEANQIIMTGIRIP